MKAHHLIGTLVAPLASQRPPSSTRHFLNEIPPLFLFPTVAAGWTIAEDGTQSALIPLNRRGGYE